MRFSPVAGLAALGLVAAIPLVSAQTVAFPGALGYGAYATGGRNGTVYHVTNTNDSGAGSFRDAVGGSGRTIVFDVGGNIKLLTAVSCKGNLTIAGQTAPGGISFDGGEISFAGRANIICRYIRVRPGSDTSSTGDDCISFYQTTNAIMDHTSLAFGPWNNIDAVTCHNISVQHCIDANPIYQQFGAHIENVGAAFSWQYNLFANSHNRNPLAKINDTYINNLLYNYQAGYTTHTGTRFSHDIVNNYFIMGPGSGGTDNTWYQVDKNQSIYYSGNMKDTSKDGALNGSLTTPYWYQGTGTILSSPWSSWTTVIPTMTPELAYRYDVSSVGAFPRDEVDRLILSQVKTLGSGTTGTGTNTAGPGTGLYTSQTQTGLSNNGYGTIVGLTAPTDTDRDGMPDYWELALGSATNSANALTNTATGYTLLENYLNYLAAPHAVTQTNTPVDVNLSQFVSGFASSATFTLTNAVNGTVTLLNSTNAHFVPTNNFAGLGSFDFVVTESGLALSVTVTICVTPLPPPASATQFNGALIGYAVAAQGAPSNLTWRGDGAGNAWNTVSSNWFNGAGMSAFKGGDVVSFDDTGSNSPSIMITNLVAPGAVLVNASKNFTFAGGGALTGSGSFTKRGTGTLTIATTNSAFTGSLDIGGGTLALNTGTSMGSGAVALSDGATLSLANGNSPISVPGAITVAAGDTVTIASGYIANVWSGTLIGKDSSTVLNLNGNQSLGGTSTAQFNGFPGTVNIFAGSNIRFSANSSGNTYGSTNPLFVINGTLQPRNGGNTITLGNLSGTGTLSGPQSNAGSGNTVYNIGARGLDVTFSGVINSNSALAGSLVCVNKLGAGTLTLNGNNTYTGTNGVLAGTLLVTGTNQPTYTTVATNATLGGTGVYNGAVTVNSGGRLSPGINGAGTFTINGNLTNNNPTLLFDLSGSPSGTNNDRINMSGTLALSGSQMFNFNLTDNALGAGTYYLIEGANNSTASSVVLTNNLLAPTRQAITLSLAATGSNPSYVRLIVSGAASSLVWAGTNGNVWDNVTVNWLNAGVADVFYNLDQVVFNDTAANGTVTLVGTLQPAVLLVTNNSRAYTFNGTGALVGSGPLTKAGSGVLTIATANSAYAGPITVAGGTLAVGSGASLGSGALTLGAGSTLALPGSGSSVFIGTPVTVPAGQSATITSGLLSSGFSGNFTAGNAASGLSLSGNLSFSATSTAQFDGFTGTINLLAGTYVRFSPNSSGNIYGSYAPAWIINGTIQPRNGGNTIELGAFTGGGALAGPQSSAGTGDTLYVLGGNNTDANFSGVISSNSALAGSVVLVNKIGTGTLTLSGSSTYTGGTTVSGGTLRVNSPSNGTGTGDLEVFSGARLTGNGVIGSATTIDDGATLAPGDSVGTLTFTNNLTLNDNSVLVFGLGTSSDAVVVGGDLALTGQLTVTNTAGFGPGSYPLFTCGGAMNLGNLVLASAPGGYNYSFDTNTPGVLKLVVALPTPPVIGQTVLTGAGQLVLSGSGGTPGAAYYVLASTNLAAAVANWTRVCTNQFDATGNFYFTNTACTNAQSFYRLLVQ
jgi:autotransporter-associated beta strand protein